jgi:hypothetical protein
VNAWTFLVKNHFIWWGPVLKPFFYLVGAGAETILSVAFTEIRIKSG